MEFKRLKFKSIDEARAFLEFSMALATLMSRSLKPSISRRDRAIAKKLLPLLCPSDGTHTVTLVHPLLPGGKGKVKIKVK